MRESANRELESALNAAEAEFSSVPAVSEKASEFLKIYNLPDAVIGEMSTRYLPLKIEDINDKKAYALVHAARIHVRDTRLEVEAARKQTNADAQNWIKTNNAEAKRITALLDPIEEHLDAEEKRVDDEIARIKAEKQRDADARLQKRIDALQAVGAPFQVSELVMMTEGAFQAILAPATEAWNLKEAKRLEAEAALEKQRQAEHEAVMHAAEEKDRQEAQARLRLGEIQKEQAAEKARLDAQAAELKAEREAINAEKERIAKEARDKQIREEAEAKAKADAERKAQEEIARKEREAQAAAEREVKAKADTEARVIAIEAAKPDAEKLNAFAVKVAAMEVPSMASVTGQFAENKIHAAVFRFAELIKAEANALTNG